MNPKTLVKKLAVAAVGFGIASGADKIADRPTGTYPTPKRLAVVVVAAIGLNYALAFAEQTLGLTADDD